MPSMASRPRYTTDNSSAAAAARPPHCTQRDEDRCGIATIVRSPFISAIRVRQPGQRLEMVFQQGPAAVAQPVAQIRAEVLPELGTGGADGVRHRAPHARPRGLERAGVHVFVFHVVQRAFQTVFRHLSPHSQSEGLRPSDSPTRSLARRFAGALRSRGSLALLARALNERSCS